jgi:hypothetical protein
MPITQDFPVLATEHDNLLIKLYVTKERGAEESSHMHDERGRADLGDEFDVGEHVQP